jgi:hypothetical protein
MEKGAKSSTKQKNYLFVISDNFCNFFLGADAFSDELIAVLVEHVLVFLDDAVHDRLREHRLVDLVVAVTTVANLEKKKIYMKQKHGELRCCATSLKRR